MSGSVMFSPTFKATAPRPGVWSPSQKVSLDKTEDKEENKERKKLEDEPIPPVWTPKSTQASPQLEKKEFRPVNFESPTLPRKKYIQEDKKESSVPPPWQQPGGDKLPELAKSPSTPALSLPKAPNPTVTLLQKAREGYLPKGARYLYTEMNESPNYDGSLIERLEIVSSAKGESDRPRKVEITPKKVSGIGPTTKEGIPLVLRSEVTEENKEKWYRRMYDSLHKAGKDDDYVTVKYRTSPSRKGLYGYYQGSSSGYKSEPEFLGHDNSTNKYATLDRRRTEKCRDNETISVTLPRSRESPPRRDFVGYKNQPGRIEDYEPGHSSISEIEANKWWDEVLEIFDRWLDCNSGARRHGYNRLLIDAVGSLQSEEEKSRPIQKNSRRSFTNCASGYISDPQYVYKRSEDELQSPPTSEEQKEAYRIIQKGGEIPLKGLRKPAPERPKDSLKTEIEYFPLSPTLTRIRVHKQNITPLYDFPNYVNPFLKQKTTLNYPISPFGVCSSYSQVQIFPAISQVSSGEPKDGVLRSQLNLGSDRKFFVQLQNISSPEYVQIVPKPRNHSKETPIYANLPFCGRSCSPIILESKEEVPESDHQQKEGGFVEGNAPAEQPKAHSEPSKGLARKSGLTTFSELKRIAPSIICSSKAKVSLGKTSKALEQRISDRKSVKGRKESLISKFSGRRSNEDKENHTHRLGAVKSSNLDKFRKKEKREINSSKSKELGDKKIKKISRKSKVPLSESILRENPLSKSNRNIQNRSEGVKSSKSPTGNSIEFLPGSVESQSVNSEALLSKGKAHPKDVGAIAMSPAHERDRKPKVDADMNEVFRSRSFSPDVRRKIFKFPDMNKPIPPKRKQSKKMSSLKIWPQTVVSYPRHRSRLDEFGSNVKFLQERLKKKLTDDKDKSEFGDDVETVRTVKKNKDGALSIKTNKYLRLPRPASTTSLIRKSACPDSGHRRLLSESRAKFDSTDPSRSPKCAAVSKSLTSNSRRLTPKPKGLVSVQNLPARIVKNSTKQDDKKKTVKVPVPYGEKESTKKTVSYKESTVPAKSPSPCPSLGSYKSGLSGRSPLSDKESISPKTRHLSPNSCSSQLSSPSVAASCASNVTESKLKRQRDFFAKSTSPSKQKSSLRTGIAKPVIKTAEGSLVPAKASAKRSLSRESDSGKAAQEELNKSLVKSEKPDLEYKKIFVKEESSKTKTFLPQKTPKNLTGTVFKENNEVTKGRDLVRTDSFFQNLFLRNPLDRRSTAEVERLSSVLERARMYQRKINWPETYKSEPSLSLVTFYLNQKRPVSYSKFKYFDRCLSSSRSHSPLGSLHSENFQMKLRRFDSLSQFGDDYYGDFSPEAKERSSSEPPLHRSEGNYSEEKSERKSRVSQSEASSMRSSPNSSRSPSCRRIRSYRTLENGRVPKNLPRARSAGEVEEGKSKSVLQYGDLAKSTSSLNLSNLSDHTEYQAYVLELMHSARKCERFRELHKFYSNLERMGKLEKTASTGDLRPRLKNEEIIDFDRWKKIRTKERAEAELKTLVDNLVKVQKEKDLLFRAADVAAVRWKGDRGLRIKERSVDDLRDQFDKISQEVDVGAWKRDFDMKKDNYKSLWKGNSIADVANNLNNPLVSYRGRPITLEEYRKIEKGNLGIGKEYGYSLKAWSSLSHEQVNHLKDQLNEIYAQDANRRGIEGSSEELSGKYEILVPKDRGVKSSGESSLQIRCSSAMSKNQTFTPTIKRKEALQNHWKKANSVSELPSLQSDDEERVDLPQLPWKEDSSSSKLTRSQSEGRPPKDDHYPIVRSKSASSKPLSENEKKRLSMTISKEVLEKMTKGSGRSPVLPRETLGALAAAGSMLRDQGMPGSKDCTVIVTPGGMKTLRNPPEIVEKLNFVSEQESASGSSETSIKTVIRKNSVDVLKRVQYFEELQQSTEGGFEQEPRNEGNETSPAQDLAESQRDVDAKTKKFTKKKKIKPSSSLENLDDYFGHQKQYTTSSLPSGPPKKFCLVDEPKTLTHFSDEKDFHEMKNTLVDKSWRPLRYRSSSPVAYRTLPSGSSSESLFSYRSRSVSPDPTKYYRAYLRMVKCGAVRRLCNKFESWEDLLSLSSDKDFWLPPAPRRFASDPELTRDLLRRFGTNPTKVTVRGQEVGDVRWLRTKFEKDLHSSRGRTHFHRARSPLVRSPITAADRFMPRINVISKKAELQLQGLASDQRGTKDAVSPVRYEDLAASPEGYRSLIDYTKDHGGYYYTGEVEKLRRKFERLQEAERLSILGQMFTSTPDMSELRDIAPYLECSWIAHRYPRRAKSPEPKVRRREVSKIIHSKPRPHSSSPVRNKQLLSILKQPCSSSDRGGIFADQKFDPSIHRPKYRYQPEREIDRRYKRGDPDWWRHWNKPTVTFKGFYFDHSKESVDFKIDPQVRDISPDSPRKYVESEVTIHYKSPVRSEAKVLLSEDELARRQAESMKRIYKEERRRKYLQELQDMNSRRHTDNFTPSQKSPIPLNRYDDFPVDANTYHSKARDYSIDPVLVARGLYDFVGRRPRELAFRRGDIIFIIRRLDKNWCEGELNGAVGLFPLSYVEVLPYNEINMKFGRARAKYDFVPQTSLELSAHKGDMITLIRKIDENWFEGRIGDKMGIIPASYCHILAMPQPGRMAIRSEKGKPVAAPAAHSLIHDGSSVPSKHYYTPYLSGPNSPGRSTVSSASANYHDGHLSADMLIDEALMQLDEEFDLKRSTSNPSQPLNVRVNQRPEPALYQVLYNHVPSNDDELELIQGETVTVVEKCGDGWYIGSKTSDGKLGIFPGTHVRRIAPEFV